jgi:hypothetical protein
VWVRADRSIDAREERYERDKVIPFPPSMSSASGIMSDSLSSFWDLPCGKLADLVGDEQGFVSNGSGAGTKLTRTIAR